MSGTNQTVFISYRRSVTRYLALSIYEKLRARGFDVFLDHRSIGAGHFEQIILKEIETRQHFVVLLTHGTLDRCAEAGDWLRREIETAIKKGRNVIPLMIDCFTFEDAEKHLTEELSQLPAYNAINLYIDYIDAGIERLCADYLQPVAPVLQVGSQAAPPPGKAVAPPSEPEPVSPPASLPAAAPEEVRKERKRKVAEIDDVMEAVEEEKTEEVVILQGVAAVPTAEKLAAEQLFIRAAGRLAVGNLQGAINDYTQAIASNPAFVAAYSYRAEGYFQLGAYREALVDFKRASGLDQNNPEYLGAEIEIAMGEQEIHVFDTSTVVVAPKGLVHCPLVTRRVDKPYGFSAICLNTEHNTTWLGETKTG